MYITKEDSIKLNYLAKGDGADALEYLADKLYEFFAHETVIAEGTMVIQNQGAARLAEWLKKVPKALRVMSETNGNK